MNYKKGGASTSATVTIASNVFELTNLSSDSYTDFSITHLGCTASDAASKTLSDPASASLTAGLVTNPTTCSGTNGKIAFATTNLPNGTYTLNFKKGGISTSATVTIASNAFELTNLSSDNYTDFSITHLGCTASDAVSKTLSDPVSASLTAGATTNPTTCAGTNGKIAFATTNLPNGTYTLNFKKGGASTSATVTIASNVFELTNLSSDNYTDFSITHLGCTASDAANKTLSDPASASLTAGLVTNPTTCSGTNGKIAFATTNLPNGTYTLNFKKGGASTSATVTIAPNVFELTNLSSDSYTDFSITHLGCKFKKLNPRYF
ncbi:hypothetical protein BC749_1174 [Flavobacterium araucananum]|uniref:hypothetical protein n=1 Tax=Flavobacterium araucananum TaxID=946678 RepID=UPI000D6D782F|nr:hypothetical protein [Flavobacterium araucananum]PWJ92209.1 hypothetical protein BC749_1174 [Flavobacterium araucananum]